MAELPILFVPLCGGLGNQMFQYCAGYIAAKINNGHLLLQNAGDNAHNLKNHNYVKLLFCDASECSEFTLDCVRYHQVKPPFSSWNPQGITLPCRLEGFFQYYPVLEPFLPELVEKFRKALSVKQTTNSAFLHIRRGDYLEKNHIHYIQGPEYYSTAYAHLKESLQFAPPRLVVFSDDIEWCKQQDWILQFPNVEFYENPDELETLAEMASCGGGAIVANSTFSWWGAILSQSKHVYYPNYWIAIPIEDLFPRHWVCI